MDLSVKCIGIDFLLLFGVCLSEYVNKRFEVPKKKKEVLNFVFRTSFVFLHQIKDLW